MNRFHRWYCRSDLWKRVLESRLPWVLGDAQLGPRLLEVGPGPGLTTSVVKKRCSSLTSLEIDPRLAAALHERTARSNVDVLVGDATRMPFEAGSFSGAVCFTMLHHVPSASLQNRLLAEVRRVLRRGGLFVGSDSLWSPVFHLIHLFDTMVPVEPSTFGSRLEAAGFTSVVVEKERKSFRFQARRPLDDG